MWLTIPLLSNSLRIILPETAPLVVILVAPSTSMADASKAFSLSPLKSVRNDAEVGERCLSHTLRFDKCLYSQEA